MDEHSELYRQQAKNVANTINDSYKDMIKRTEEILRIGRESLEITDKTIEKNKEFLLEFKAGLGINPNALPDVEGEPYHLGNMRGNPRANPGSWCSRELIGKKSDIRLNESGQGRDKSEKYEAE